MAFGGPVSGSSNNNRLSPPNWISATPTSFVFSFKLFIFTTGDYKVFENNNSIVIFNVLPKSYYYLWCLGYHPPNRQNTGVKEIAQVVSGLSERVTY